MSRLLTGSVVCTDYSMSHIASLKMYLFTDRAALSFQVEWESRAGWWFATKSLHWVFMPSIRVSNRVKLIVVLAYCSTVCLSKPQLLQVSM